MSETSCVKNAVCGDLVGWVPYYFISRVLCLVSCVLCRVSCDNVYYGMSTMGLMLYSLFIRVIQLFTLLYHFYLSIRLPPSTTFPPRNTNTFPPHIRTTSSS